MGSVIRLDDLPVTNWRNGLGRKADIATGDGWALSFAWLDADAPFSDFGGHNRTQILLAGAGFVLEFNGHPSITVDQPHVPHRYDGGLPVRARLLDGPCLVLNVISARDRWSHAVKVTEDVPAEGFAIILDDRYDVAVLPHLLEPAPGTRLVAIRFTPTA